MNEKYDVLEKCLLEIEQGADVDTVLFPYPEFADELRPILEASIKAMDMARDPSIAMVQINRAELLRRATVMREAKAKSTGIWFTSLRRLSVTVAVLAILFISGTGLVHASSTTIPGDNLYPVKRTWEDVLLLFTINPQQREQMEVAQENERLDELNELFTERRSVQVDFSGYVTRLNGNEWRVAAISVLVLPQTILPNEPISVGSAVRVIGVTQSDQTVLAERIELLPTGTKLPEVKDPETNIEEENSDTQTPQVDDNSNSGSENEAPQIDVTKTPSEDSYQIPNVDSTSTPKVESTSEQKSFEFEGVLQSFDNNIWVISGRSINVGSATIEGTPAIGATAKVAGYKTSSGDIVVTKVEVSGGGSDGSGANTSTSTSADHEEDH
jgi:uncharacterized protein DUF5667/uncharacterized protein DUF5666